MTAMTPTEAYDRLGGCLLTTSLAMARPARRNLPVGDLTIIEKISIFT
jgi:hypothetical protein